MKNYLSTFRSELGFNVEHLLDFTGSKRVPIVLQSEISECGLACLAMVSSFYGHIVNLTTLRNGYNFDNGVMELRQLIDASNKLDLSTRALKCDLDEMSKLRLPCILHWNLDHYVVLTKISNGKYHINDPSVGKLVVTKKKLSDSFTGIVLELTPNCDFKKEDNRVTMKLEQLWGKITGLKRSLLSLFALSMVIQVMALLAPYYMQWVVDSVLISNDQSFLLALAIGFMLLKLIQIAVSSFRSWFLVRLNSTLSIQMGANLFNHLVRLPISYFESRHVGDVVSRFGSLGTIRELITTGLVEGIIDGIMSIMVLIMMYIYSPILTSVVMSFLVTFFFVQYLFFNPNRTLEEEYIVSEAKEDSFFLESIRGIQTLKLFNQETNRLNSWLNKYADVMNIGIRQSKLSIIESAIVGILFGIESIIVIYLGAKIVMKGDMTVGMLLAFIAYKGYFISSMSSFVGKWISFKMMAIHLDRLSDITLESKEISGNLNVESSCPTRGHIKVVNLGFKYSNKSDWVFRNISFDLLAGESLAITGESGCGKSTLMKVILGLLKPTEGKVYLDGVDIEQLRLSDYRKKVCAVMQNDTLLSGTLAENITMFDPEIDSENLINSCDKACILDAINRLPLQFNTLVGDMGNVFSGGQLQRIYLARALYQKPIVLCLDESTSHLDHGCEKKINYNLKEINVTNIVIAHRIETIKSADRVISLDCYKSNK